MNLNHRIMNLNHRILVFIPVDRLSGHRKVVSKGSTTRNFLR